MNSKWFIILMALGLSSCYKILEIDINTENLPMSLTMKQDSDSAWLVSLTEIIPIMEYYNYQDMPYAEIPRRPVNDAILEIFKDGQYYSPLVLSQDGNYRCPKDFEPGHKYELQLNRGELKSNGSFVMPRSGAVEKIEVSEIENPTTYLNVNLKIDLVDVNPDQNNYFLIKLETTSTYITNTLYPISFTTKDPNSAMPERSGLDTEFDTGGEQYDKYFYYFVISDRLLSQGKYKFECSFGWSLDNPYYDCVVSVHTLSEEKFKYLYSIELQNYSRNDPFSQPAEIQGNVKGLQGVFAVDAVDKFIIK